MTERVATCLVLGSWFGSAVLAIAGGVALDGVHGGFAGFVALLGGVVLALFPVYLLDALDDVRLDAGLLPAKIPELWLSVTWWIVLGAPPLFVVIFLVLV